jgi:hypothetical protein
MMDKIYEDFTTKLLPSIQEGLVITKDYFMDLFGRYVKYLIISDAIWMVLGPVISITAYKFVRFFLARRALTDDYDDSRFGYALLVVASTLMVFVGVVIFLVKLDDVVKDIYIPEVRVYQEITNQMNHPHPAQ